MARLMRKWALGRTTGTVTITAPAPADVTCTVLVENGAVVFASRRSKKDPTGELFLEIFQVPEFDGENADEIEMIESQTARVVTDLFNWPMATVQFKAGIGLTRWPQLDLPFPELMLRGMRSVIDTHQVREWLGDPSRTFVRGSDPFGMSVLQLDGDAQAILDLLDKPRRAAEFVTDSQIDEDVALRLVAAFMFTGTVEPGSSNIPVPQPQPTASSEPEPEPEYDPAETARFWYAVEEKLRIVKQGVDYYALLEVERKATADEIVSGYRELAMYFHPDRNARFAPRDEDGRTVLDVIFDALTTAFAVLTKPTFREVYDQELMRQERDRAVPVAPELLLRTPSGQLAEPVAVDDTPSLEEIFDTPSDDATPEPAPEADAEPTPSAQDDPPEPAPTSYSTAPLTSVDWFRRGEEYAGTGDYFRASNAFDRALQLAPDNVRIMFALARALAHIPEQQTRAEHMLLNTIQVAPFMIPAFVELANLHARAGRTDEARTQLKRALAINATDSGAVAALAELDRSEKRISSGFLRKILRG